MSASRARVLAGLLYSMLLPAHALAWGDEGQLEDRPVLILNMTDTQAAHVMLEELPLGKAHLMTFQLTPIGPLNLLRQLLVPAAPL